MEVRTRRHESDGGGVLIVAAAAEPVAAAARGTDRRLELGRRLRDLGGRTSVGARADGLPREHRLLARDEGLRAHAEEPDEVFPDRRLALLERARRRRQERAVGERDRLVDRRAADALHAVDDVVAVLDRSRAGAAGEARARADVPADRGEALVVRADAAILIRTAARLVDLRAQPDFGSHDLGGRFLVGARSRRLSFDDRLVTLPERRRADGDQLAELGDERALALGDDRECRVRGEHGR